MGCTTGLLPVTKPFLKSLLCEIKRIFSVFYRNTASNASTHKTLDVVPAHYLHIRYITRGFILQQPQHRKHPLHRLFWHFFADIYSMLKTEVALKENWSKEDKKCVLHVTPPN